MTDAWSQEVPVGDAFFERLLNECRQHGGRIETHALELKGADVRPDKKPGAAKIAKFLLGAANRDPDLARQQFGGYAIMVVGVEEDGTVSEIPRCEELEINSQLEGYLGGEPIRWTTHWAHPTGVNTKGVLFILVPPPRKGDQIRWCRKDGDNLKDGGIYIRKRGETCAAKGIDLEMLTRRAEFVLPLELGISIRIVQVELVDYEICHRRVENAVVDHAKILRSVLPEANRDSLFMQNLSGSGYMQERRSPQEYLSAIGQWEARNLANLDALSQHLVLHSLPSLSVKIVNEVDAFISDLQIDFEFEIPEGGYLLERHDPGGDLGSLFSTALKPPLAWGKDTGLSGISSLDRLAVAPAASRGDSSTFEVNPESRTGTLWLNDLRPRAELALEFSDVVLFSVEEGLPTPGVQWSATANGRDARYRGEALIEKVPFRADGQLQSGLREALGTEF